MIKTEAVLALMLVAFGIGIVAGVLRGGTTATTRCENQAVEAGVGEIYVENETRLFRFIDPKIRTK